MTIVPLAGAALVVGSLAALMLDRAGANPIPAVTLLIGAVIALVGAQLNEVSP